LGVWMTMSNRATVSRSHPAPSPATLARFATPRSRTGDEGIMRAAAKAWTSGAAIIRKTYRYQLLGPHGLMS
ncbi:MAG: hypothetical protein KKE67_12565, partial [Alphaproteobacteria bacterium]|nr:hypothetical protein [Alphaproteobacteria bacterium]